MAHFLLNFGTTLGRVRTFRVNNPNTALLDTPMRNAMQNMVNSHAVDGPTGRINSLRAAALIEQTVTPVPLP